ncbi:quinone oxidoreductase [soil metagenome]
MTAQQGQALVVTRHGGPEVLELQQSQPPLPGPGPHELAVDVAAAGVNFVDVYQREGVYPIPTPFVLGSEGAGVVTAIGEQVSEFAVGDRVAWASSLTGSAATTALVAEGSAVPVPVGVDSAVAAASMLQGLTAHYLLNSTYAVQPGDTVLVHAAAGGVGQLLIQLAKAKGATVIGTVSTAAKADRARTVGADHIINYLDVADVGAAVRDLTGGIGVAAVYDGVGKSTFEGSLAALRIRGTLALFGAASGQVPPFDLQRLNRAGSLFVTRPTLVHYIATRQELLQRSNDILGAVANGSLIVEIGGRYPLSDAATAYGDLEGRRTMGKLLLIP